MGSDLGVCANIVRVSVVIVNILFAVVGIAVLGIGAWLIDTNQSFSFITGNEVIGGAALLIVAGGVTVIICAIGIIGAIFKLRPLLVVYALVVLTIVILEIVAGILGFVFQDRVVSTVREGSLRAISLYTRNPDGGDRDAIDATNAIDAFQNTFRCCGYNNASDWISTNPRFLRENEMQPPGYLDGPANGCSRCTPGTDPMCQTFTGDIPNDPPTLPDITVTFNVTEIGCVDRVRDNVVPLASITGAIGIVFGLLEIAGIVLAVALCCCITSARKQEIV